MKHSLLVASILLVPGLQGCSLTGSEVAAIGGLVGAASTIAYASSGASVGSASSGGGRALPSSGGYSQRQSFEDCRSMYLAAGMPSLAQQCAQRATNMNSLH